MKTHTLHIAGQRLTIRSAADPVYLEALAADLESRVKTLGAQGASPVTAALLAGLALADEAQRSRDALATLQQTVRARAAALREAAEEP
ncbi:MAG: cell division protein ZapA [Myxococcales bacterium]|nr:cell division protein ZapA [Myxococcales bacterium]